MGLASGPFAEVDQSRLADGQVPQEIMPGMVKLIEPDLTGGGQPVYRFHQINSHAKELLGVIASEAKACDESTGVPAYAYGGNVGGVGRTVGGLAMLMGNASKALKKVIGHIEKDVLEPLITSMYNYNMLYDEDDSIKVDAQIVARGPTGIIMREAQIQRQMEALQLITPYAQSGIVPPQGLAVLLRSIMTGLDLDADKIIPNPERQAQLKQAAGEIGGQAPQQGGQMPQAPGGGQGSGQPVPQMQQAPEAMQGSNPVIHGKGEVHMQQGAVGQGTTPMAIPDGRSGLAAGAVF
jgi:hypothetical protein